MVDLNARLNAGPIHALSIRQPWIHHILHDGKDVENRDWPTQYRGWVLLHASKTITKTEMREFKEDFGVDLPLGGICGAARITDCVTSMASRWFVGRYGFVLADATPLPLVPMKGALGFMPVPQEIVSAILKAREATHG
jgi:hypothetical protein